MNFFGIGAVELVFVLVVALLILGPNKMVETARTLGKYVRELQRAASELPKLLNLDEEPPKAELPPRQTISDESTGSDDSTGSDGSTGSDEPAGQQSDEKPEGTPRT